MANQRDYANTTVAAANHSSPCPIPHDTEGLCRPRFFPGQLLTDADLNLLNRYIIEKRRLHNRYLHDWASSAVSTYAVIPAASV